MSEYMSNNKWCVYLHIVHSDCGFDKYYVGITSTSPQLRWGKNGNGYFNQVFGKAIKKYGWNNIDHKIIEDNLSELDAKKLEQKYIQIYNSCNKKYGYNLTNGGDGSLGWHPSAETKLKISKSLSGKNHPMYGRQHSDEYKQYMRKINLGKKMKPEDRKKLSERKKNDIAIGKIEPPMKNKKHSEESKQKISMNRIGKNISSNHWKSKRVYRYSLDGIYIDSFDSTLDAKRTTGISNSLISACCRNEKQSAGGFLWSYKKASILISYEKKSNPGKTVKQYQKDGTYIKDYNNIHEAHVVTGANESNISACCRGIRKSCGGYVWKFA